VPITRVQTRRGLPPANIKARVIGRGKKLAYSFNAAPGRTVTFFEQGRTVGRQIGETSNGRGTLAFPSGLGQKGRREVLALITQDGFPRERIRVTAYTAPGAPPVAKPTRLRAVHGRDRVDLVWRKVRGAARYRLDLTVGDGRVKRVFTRRTRYRVPAYTRDMTLSAKVTAISKPGRESKPATLRIKSRRTRVKLTV
jgi:hypothetical protein